MKNTTIDTGSKIIIFQKYTEQKKTDTEISLVVQRLRLQAPNAGSLGSIPGQGTGAHVPQLRVCMLQLKILHTSTKTQHSQINK